MEQSEILNEVGKFASLIITRSGTTEEDAVKVAAAFLVAAETIFERIGGQAMAAAQFYAAADRCASPRR